MASSEVDKYRVRFYDKTVSRHNIDVSSRPDDWDPTKQKAGVYALRTSDYIPFDLAKSALQKAIRRRNADEAVYWTISMFQTVPKGVSNLWNRLLVISVEDVGPAYPNAISLVYWLYLTGKDNIYNVVQAAYLLAACEKSRFTDLCYHYFNKFNTDMTTSQMIDKIVENIYKPYSQELLMEMISYIPQIKVRVDEEKRRSKAVKDEMVQKLKAQGKDRKVRAKPVKDQLNVLLGKIANLNNGENQGYVDQMKSAKDNFGVLGVIQLVVCLHKRYELSTVHDVQISDRVKWITDEMSKGRYKFNVPDYALDKHTKQGRALNRGTMHFLVEASNLENRGGEWIATEDWLLNKIIETERQ